MNRGLTRLTFPLPPHISPSRYIRPRNRPSSHLPLARQTMRPRPPHNVLWSPHRAEKKTIPAHGKALINTQLSIAVPEGTYGRVAPRSGLGKLVFNLRRASVPD